MQKGDAAVFTFFSLKHPNKRSCCSERERSKCPPQKYESQREVSRVAASHWNTRGRQPLAHITAAQPVGSSAPSVVHR